MSCRPTNNKKTSKIIWQIFWLPFNANKNVCLSQYPSILFTRSFIRRTTQHKRQYNCDIQFNHPHGVIWYSCILCYDWIFKERRLNDKQEELNVYNDEYHKSSWITSCCKSKRQQINTHEYGFKWETRDTTKWTQQPFWKGIMGKHSQTNRTRERKMRCSSWA